MQTYFDYKLKSNAQNLLKPTELKVKEEIRNSFLFPATIVSKSIFIISRSKKRKNKQETKVFPN